MPQFAQILIVDDEETDVLLLGHAFEQASLKHKLIVVRDGQEGVEYLTRIAQSNGVGSRLPDLVLLDLKMPRLDGFQVLAWRSEQPRFNDVPFIVLTSSSYDSDQERALVLGAADFWVKPSSFRQLVSMALELDARWLTKELNRRTKSTRKA